MLRSHTCGELRPAHVGMEVTVVGWVHRRRDHGPLIFLDLRDRYGLTQVVIDSAQQPVAHAVASDVRSEYVLAVVGSVGQRPDDAINPELATGAIEVYAREIQIINASKTPPLLVAREAGEEESLRLKYRYLDLRRERMQHNIITRHRAVKFLRDFLDEEGFLEIETPILIKSTPEGARDYLVPSRLHPGKFYALPQSPQQLKQLLMVAGFDKYFQIARCFRDEDQRADRQVEFTQLDIEMSFIETDDIFSLIERLLLSLVHLISPDRYVMRPFAKLTYAEAMQRFGSDKPDMRYGLELVDVSDIFHETTFQVFRDVLAAGGEIRGIRVPGCGEYSRKQLDGLTELAQTNGAKGLAWMALPRDTTADVRSSFGRFVSDTELQQLHERFWAIPGDLLLLVADKPLVVARALGRLRQEFGHRLNLIPENVLSFAWVVDFPLLEWNEEDQRWYAMHHPFTAPHPDDRALLEKEPSRVRAQAYDITLNGYELGGGSIRIHEQELQHAMFRVLGIGENEAHAQFGHLLEAFEYGAPPHGGIALGIDRLVMVLLNEVTLREVIAFPKNQQATDVMSNAPSEVDEKQLQELSLRIVPPRTG